MAGFMHAFDSLDLFAELAKRRAAIPYPLQPATQLSDENISDRRRAFATAQLVDHAEQRILDQLADVCQGHRRSIDLRYTEGGTEFGAVVLMDGPGHESEAWIVRCSGRDGHTWTVPVDRAISAVMDLMPPVPPALLRPLSMTGTTLAALSRPGLTETERDRLARAAGSQLAVVRAALTAVGAVVGVGQIGALARTGAAAGPPIRAEQTVTITDGTGGRMMRLGAPAASGEQLVTLSPGTAPAMHAAIARMLTRTSTMAHREGDPAGLSLDADQRGAQLVGGRSS